MEIPEQFELIENYVQNTIVKLTGTQLVGELDFMFRNTPVLYPTDPELKIIFTVKTEITASDVHGHSVEASTDMIFNVYNYENDMRLPELYGLYCCAVISNHYIILNKIIAEGIKHNDEIYKPTIIVPSFQKAKPDLVFARNKAYGES